MHEERIIRTHKIKNERELEIIMELELDELVNELRLLYENNLELQEYSKNDEEIKEYVQDNNAIIVQKTKYVVDFQKELKEKFPKNKLNNVNIFEIFSIIDSNNGIKKDDSKENKIINSNKIEIDDNLDCLDDLVIESMNKEKEKSNKNENSKYIEVYSKKEEHQGFVGCKEDEEVDVLNSKNEIITELEL